ncbi:MAG: hypothetical protein KC468_06870, partial [Myxococcales bacterium]|nr:hypothetical protein [Myxococcales bacterium]
FGLLCWNDACVEMCVGTPDHPLCDPGATCVLDDQGTRPLCLAECDPLLQDCDVGGSCAPAPDDESFICLPDESGGTAPAGTPCEQHTECNIGHACAPTELFPAPACEEGGSCCAPYCDLTNGNADCEGLP